VKNSADALVFQTEKNLKDYGDKISEEDKSTIEADLKDLKEYLEKDDLDNIKKKTEDLTQSSMKMGEAMYKDQQSEQPADSSDSTETNSGEDSKKDDDVIDADFEEVDEDKTADSK
jgi:molecular chaperone DnaK